jgi:HK97 family phage portal protein
MQSLIDRVNSVNAPRKAHAEKSYSSGSLWTSAYSSPNYDLRSDEYGAAQAVAVVTEVQRAVKFWGNELGGLNWNIHDGATDKILVSSMNRKPPTGKGAMWAASIRRFARAWKHGFFESIAFSDWVYGESFIWKRRNQVQIADFMWLNPLATEPMIYNGDIAYYQYQSNDPDLPFQLKVDEVAFRIANRNPFDDLRGVSPVLTAINDINIVENVKRSLNGYYRNHMQIGGIVSPAGDTDITGTSINDIKEEMQRGNKGSRNAFNWFFSNAPVKIDPFQPLDIEKNYAIVEPIRKQIAMAMGVPPILSGDPTDATYENTKETLKNWWQTDGIPYASQVAEFVNESLLPAVEPGNDIYFAFDFTPFEIEDPETVSADVAAGYGEITESQKKRGLKVDPALEGIYIIGGKPMHRDIIAQIAKQLPLEYAQAQPPAPVLPATLPQGEPVSPMAEPALPAVTEESVLSLDTEKHAHAHEPAIETWDYTPSLARKELAAWQRHIKAKASRPFEPRYTRGDIADLVTSGLASGADMIPVFDSAFALLPSGLDSLKTAFIAVFDAIAADDDITATKSVQAIRLDFEGRFADVLNDIRSGNVDNRRRAGDILRQLIRTFGYRAYVQGLQDGGVMDNPSEEDEAEIASLRSAQSTFVSNITRVLIREDGVSDSQAAGKPDMWWRGSIQPFYNAGLASANANGLYEWTLGQTESHCVTCPRLNGQRHRLKHWRAKNLEAGTVGQATECKGYECKCRLVPASGKASGKW